MLDGFVIVATDFHVFVGEGEHNCFNCYIIVLIGGSIQLMKGFFNCGLIVSFNVGVLV